MMALTLVFDTKYSKEVNIIIDEGVNIEIDWGNGTKIKYSEYQINYTYTDNSIYTVKITGRAKRIILRDNNSLVECTSFGDLGLTSFSSMFSGCTNLIVVPKQLPSTVTDTNYMFCNADNFNSDISSWNVSKVTNMDGMFYNAIVFNVDISSWNVSKVTDMRAMFHNAAVFDADISSWDVSKVVDMSNMFHNANMFNANISVMERK